MRDKMDIHAHRDVFLITMTSNSRDFETWKYAEIKKKKRKESFSFENRTHYKKNDPMLLTLLFIYIKLY